MCDYLLLKYRNIVFHFLYYSIKRGNAIMHNKNGDEIVHVGLKSMII